jgi:glycosyltransferase involved in cell wall biosynthesis
MDNVDAVSIVLPTYNASRFLRESIQSCLGQTYRDLEVICVDGGSTDGTLDILQEYMARDPRISLIHQPANSGKLPGALSIGFAHTRGAFLTWMQADSLYTPRAIQAMKEFFDEHAEVDFTYANYWVIGEDSSKIIEAAEVGEPEEIKWDNPIGMCHLWRRRVYEVIGDHHVDAFLAEDYEYWCRIYQHGFKMRKLDEFLYYWRRHAESLTFDNYGFFKAKRVAARVRYKFVNHDWRLYARSVSQSYIEEAFVRHARRDARGTRRAVLPGLLYNPAWMRNRGVVSILLQSLTGRLKPSDIVWPPG